MCLLSVGTYLICNIVNTLLYGSSVYQRLKPVLLTVCFCGFCSRLKSGLDGGGRYSNIIAQDRQEGSEVRKIILLESDLTTYLENFDT